MTGYSVWAPPATLTDRDRGRSGRVVVGIPSRSRVTGGGCSSGRLVFWPMRVMEALAAARRW